ncbi:hypothetical protein B0H15DRAFT_547229 [Mycena belliarum]|uniref:F-box domain-containing protein n=1 Tax=Mycena belliarum TaxID=1033014 RepID=A0AAD6UED5_9AGAR|nr:hypothetical protein B0H15DRAFT_547229 [Mycena belliae]
MLSLDALPPDILLQVVPFLTLLDVISLSMVNKSLYALSQEHSFWLDPLRVARLSVPLACPTTDDLAAYATGRLKQLALHSIRLARNWGQPVPQIAGPVQTFACGVHNSILCCLPGTDAILLHSLAEGTMLCVDVKTGLSSNCLYVGRILDMSSPLEERGRWMLAILLDQQVVVVAVAVDPAVSIEVTFRHAFEPGYSHSGIFMTESVVGFARAQWSSGGIEIQSFNILNPGISTTIFTDRLRDGVWGSTVIGDTVYFIFLLTEQAFVYACPPGLLAYAAPSPDMDFTLRRSHVARIPAPLGCDGVRGQPFDYCVLSSEPTRGRNTISVVRRLGPGAPSALEITFWPRPDTGKLRPAQTVSVPGVLRQANTAWELLIIANSGLAVVLVIRPPEPPVRPSTPPSPSLASSDSESESETPEPPPPPPPKLMMVRCDPHSGALSLHELATPAAAPPSAICALALDDHRGLVILVTANNVLHYVPYA